MLDFLIALGGREPRSRQGSPALAPNAVAAYLLSRHPTAHSPMHRIPTLASIFAGLLCIFQPTAHGADINGSGALDAPKPAVCVLIDIAALRESAPLAPVRRVLGMVEDEAGQWSRQQLGFDITRAQSMSIIWPTFESLNCYAIIHQASSRPAAVALEVDPSLPRLLPSRAAVTSTDHGLTLADVTRIDMTPRHPWHLLKGSDSKWRHKELPWTYAALERDWVVVGESALIDEALKRGTSQAANTRRQMRQLKSLHGHILLTADWGAVPQGIYHQCPGLFAFAQGQSLRCWAQFGREVVVHGTLDFEDQHQAAQACETSQMFVAMARGILLKQNQQDHAVLKEESGILRPASLLIHMAGRRQFESTLESVQLRQGEETLHWSIQAPADSVAWLLALWTLGPKSPVHP